MISEGQLEGIAATRIQPLTPGATVRTMPVELRDAGSLWGAAQVLYAPDPDGRTIELIQLPHEPGSTS